jgi:hypothetical protein
MPTLDWRKREAAPRELRCGHREPSENFRAFFAAGLVGCVGLVATASVSRARSASANKTEVRARIAARLSHPFT